MKWFAGIVLAASSVNDVSAQTYECMSKVTPGAIYLSYGTPCPQGAAVKARAQAVQAQTILKADARGQYFATAYINGIAVRSQIDTGATNVALNMDDARRMGVDFTGARRGSAQTANGTISVFFVNLASVQVGDMVLNNVPGTVGEGGASQQSMVLIGMSFLRHFEMRHAGDTLTLLRPGQ
jgi:aspartyl protease family protein